MKKKKTDKFPKPDKTGRILTGKPIEQPVSFDTLMGEIMAVKIPDKPKK